MNKTVIYSIASFVGGAAIASLITWKVVDKACEKKYDDLYQKEVASLKECFTVPKADLPSKNEEMQGDSPVKKLIDKAADRPVNKPPLAEYSRRVSSYMNYSNVKDVVDEDLSKAKPYVISPDEFGENEFYDKEELTLYSDGILADIDDNILNIDEYVGEKSLDHIGDYEADVVHIKNDARKTYYEVLVDERSYLDVTGKEADEDYNLYRRLGKDEEGK